MLLYVASYPRSGNFWSQNLLRHYFGLTIYSVYVPSPLVELLDRFGDTLTKPDVQDTSFFLTPEQRQKLAEADGCYVIKTHELPFKEYFAGEKVIHIIRHPGATLWSYYHYLRDVDRIKVNLEEVISGYVGVGSWSNYIEEWLKAAQLLGSHYLRYSYEQLHQDEAMICQEIAQLTDLPILQPPGTLPTFAHWKTQRPTLARSGQKDEWQAHFTRAHVKLLLQYHEKTMKKLGYSVDASQFANTDTRLDANQELGDIPAMQSIRLSPAKQVRYRLWNALKPIRLGVSNVLKRFHLYRPYLKLKQAIVYRNRISLGDISPDEPIIFHITHHKAGSQWVAEVLKHCVATERVVPPQSSSSHFSPANLRPGAVFPTVYKSRQHFERVTRAYTLPMRKFVVIRDLRDTLVSLYFSMRYSHVEGAGIMRMRGYLTQMGQEEGFLFLLGVVPAPLLETVVANEKKKTGDEVEEIIEVDKESHLPLPMDRIARIQMSWIKADNCLLVRYEDLVADEYNIFLRIIEHCNIQVSPGHLYSVIAHNSFETRTGRKAGEEDIMAHHRKGIAGDWRNYFTDTVKKEFKQRFGQVLIETGYEDSLDW